MSTAPLTRQQLFDNALNGIRAQGYKRSVGPTGACAYRGPGGLKCGIGHSLPDAVANSLGSLNTYTVTALWQCLSDVRELIHVDDVSFAAQLQRTHDREFKAPAEFEERMQLLAISHGLTYTPRR